MKLPRLEQAVVPQTKIVEYLLSPTHPDGSSKERFFIQFGFSVSSWQALASALLEHAANHEIAKMERSPFGTRYVIEGIMYAPDGRMPVIRSVWFIEATEQTPRFVTAYPLERSRR